MIFVIIMLFVVGIGILIGSLFLKNDETQEDTKASNEYLNQLLEERINQVENHIGDVAEKSATSAQRQAQQELERLSREKMSQVNEYSDQVMDQINKNHSEVMFLYGLLSDKQKELDETVESLNRAQKELQVSQMLNRQKEKKDKWNDTVESNIKETTNYSADNKASIDEAMLSESIKKVYYDEKEDAYKQENVNSDTQNSDEAYDKRTLIMKLQKEGKTELEIAKQLSMGVGEVRLFLELSKGAEE